MQAAPKDISVEEAAQDPKRFFGQPGAVLHHPRLTKEEKRQILESWQTDAGLLQIAEDENMSGGERGHLHEVAKALDLLRDRR